MSRGSFCEEVTFEVRLEDEKEPAKQRSGGNLPGRRYRNIRAGRNHSGIQRNKIRQE